MATVLHPRSMGKDQTSIPLRIQTVIMTPLIRIIVITIGFGNFFLLIRMKSSIAPITNKQAVADKIAVLLNSGRKSGVPRINPQNQA